MKKYFVFVIAIVALVVMASGCTSQNGNNTTATKAYSANGISFNYPSDWSVINETANETITGVITGDVSFNQSNGTKGNGLIVLKIPNNTNSSSEVTNIRKQFTNGTNSTINVAGVSANMTSINASANNVTALLKFVDFSKNNFIYLIQYTSVSNGTVTPEGIFDNITQSLQVS